VDPPNNLCLLTRNINASEEQLREPESLFRTMRNALEKFRLKTEIKKAQKKMDQMSTRDDLTGLCNRPYFIKVLARQIEKAARDHCILALCIVTLDHFRQVNDT
jgi:PleD family two-component response regulator